MEVINLIIPAFIAGLLTFLAPCTLPLVPGFLAFISGVSAKDLDDPNKKAAAKKTILFNAFMYVLGFSIIFILLGSIFGGAGSLLGQHRLVLAKVGGVFVIFFGLYLMNFFNLPGLRKIFLFLYKEHHFNLASKLTPGKPSSSFIFGATFAFGWTPCVGPILGSLLVLATDSGTFLQGAFLLAVFSIGLAVPFMLLALGLGKAAQYISKISKYLSIISFIGGAFLVFLGYLILTNNLIVWVGTFYQWFNILHYDFILNYL